MQTAKNHPRHVKKAITNVLKYLIVTYVNILLQQLHTSRAHKECKHEGIRYLCDQCKYAATDLGHQDT